MGSHYNWYNVTEKCKECKGTDIFTDRTAGEVICRECGVVLGERLIDDGAEWRSFNNDDTLYGNRDDPNRAGGAMSPLLSAESGLNTFIEGGRDSQETAKLQRVQGKANKESASEVALKECYVRVREIANSLGLPRSVQEDACLLLRQVEDKGLFQHKRGVRGDAMCAAVTYLTCRQQGVSRTLAEVAPAAGITKKDIAKSFKHLERNMKLDRGTVRGEHLVPRFCGILGVRSAITIAAKHVAKAATELDLVGGMIPQAVAAAAILLVCSCCHAGSWRELDGAVDSTRGEEDEAPGAAAIAEASGFSEKAISRPFRAMYELRERLLTEELLKNLKLKDASIEDLPCVL